MAPRDSEKRPSFSGEQSEDNNVSEKPSSYDGISKYPTGRDKPFRLAEDWIEGKRKDDNIGNLWRIHDKLYNLEPYITRHPGGQDWLIISRGLDITEAFESAHMVNPEIVERVLKEFYVGEASTPRISPFTFKEDGFFKVLKKRAAPILKKIGSGPTTQMKMMEDSLVAGFVLFGVLGAVFNSWICCIISGVILACVEVGAHNFFHLKDTFRRFYFDLGLGNSYEWRITHFFSHHLYPNTVMDIELKLCPSFEFLPHIERSWAQTYLPVIYSHFLYCFLFWIDFVKRWYHVSQGNVKVRPEHLIVIFELMFLMLVAPDRMAGFISWVIIHTAASFTLLEIGQNGQHHHPNIFHDGDEARPDPDFGLGQLDATRDRVETVFQNLFLVLITFGHHTLHHLFPTVCHSKLPLLEGVFVETLKEFEEEWIKFPHWELYLGLYKQLARTERFDLKQLRAKVDKVTFSL
jgi:cytochrome b involved in lipid metabolism